MTNRRKFVSTLAAGTMGLAVVKSSNAYPEKHQSRFKFCLNTSTISGQKPGLKGYIQIAAKTGYDGVELWVRDVKQYLDAGNSARSLKQFIANEGISVEGAIGFAPWLKNAEGMQQMREEMELMRSIGCKRIAAPASGLNANDELDFREAGEKFHQLIEIGKEIDIAPCLEFWGASPVLWNMPQVLAIAAYANHPDVKILADVYHMFRGGTGFDTLKMLNGRMLELFHMNDFVNTIPRLQQKDSDRVYPGDGAAPMREILTDLKNIGGEKVLSLELFNPNYWKEDAAEVAKTGLGKMKRLLAEI